MLNTFGHVGCLVFLFNWPFLDNHVTGINCTTYYKEVSDRMCLVIVQTPQELGRCYFNYMIIG